MIEFIIQSICILTISFLIYKFLLKKEKSFHFNRIYLLITLLFSFTIPFVEFENEQLNEFITSSKVIALPNSADVEESEGVSNIETVIPAPQSNFTPLLIYSIYGSISILLLFRFLINIRSLVQLVSKNKSLESNPNIILLEEPITPFSFFNYLFVSKVQFNKGQISEHILQHEIVHGKQLHSIDILLIELCIVVFWFNPFVWLYKNEISENHEYLADNEMLLEGVEPKEYSNEIIKSATANNSKALVCGFSFIQTKNRIKMLHQKKSPTLKVITKLGLALILIAGLLFVSSYKYVTPGPNSQYVVIIDAGHGGKDQGAAVEHTLEKDITLSIVNRLKIADTDPDIKLIFTREDDQFVELKDRWTIANNINADLFISLHANSGAPSVNGLEIYIPEDSLLNARSKEAAMVMGLYVASTNYKEFRIKEASYTLLNQVRHPAFFIELGFLTNEHDLALLQDQETLNSIANSIYKGLIDLKEGNTSLR